MSKQTHDYHLVDPSPLPIIATISIFTLAVGAILFMHNKPLSTIILSAGFLSVIYVLVAWWRKVISEARDDKAHKPVVKDGLRFGMLLFITSEVMFFFAFFFAFFDASLFPVDIYDGDVWPVREGFWPPAGIITFDPWGLPFINTIILLASSGTVHVAHHAMLSGKRNVVVPWLAITVILGFTFTCLQAYEYHHAQFGFTDGIYASTFYLATGFHGAHVLIGTIFLTVCLVRAKAGTITKQSHLSLEFASWYWHFVDVVWIFLFIWVYVWGG